MPIELTKKNIIVTGAGGGIGRATCLKLAESGANLVLVDRDEKLVAVTKEAVDKLGVKSIVVIADVTKEADVNNYVAKAVEAFGTIDGFFNNAGIEGTITPITEQSEEDCTCDEYREDEDLMELHSRPRYATAGNVWIDGEWTEDRLVVRIVDDGEGYPPHLLGRIGDPFVRSRRSAGARHPSCLCERAGSPARPARLVLAQCRCRAAAA